MNASRCGGMIRFLLLAATLALLVAGCSDDDTVAPDVPFETDVVFAFSRAATYPASAPSPFEPDPLFTPENRVPTIRWFHPPSPTYRYELNPDLCCDERLETVFVTELLLRDDGDTWDPDDWGGVMRGVRWYEDRDISGTAFLSVWVNDFAIDEADRSGRLHIDVGTICEDFIWPDTGDGPEYGTRQTEDINHDGVFVLNEDVGLDAIVDGDELIEPGRPFSVDEGTVEDPYPDINNTAWNGVQDDEDLDRNTILDLENDYLAFVIDLADTTAFIDVVRDYDYPPIDGDAWRLYQLPLHSAEVVGEMPVLHDVRHLRIWYEDDAFVYGRETVRLQIAAPVFE